MSGKLEGLPPFEQTTPREQELLRRAGIRGQVLVDGQLVSVRDQEDLVEVLERGKGGQSEQKARS